MKQNIKKRNISKKVAKVSSLKKNTALVEKKIQKKQASVQKLKSKAIAKPKATPKKETLNASYFDLIIRPIVTEKATNLSALAKTTFKVADSANKKTVKEAVEKIYDVEVKKVCIINVRGKAKVFKGIRGTRSGYKKAIVTLSGTKQIDLTGAI
jgi:large subunit ribosomal protein L23